MTLDFKNTRISFDYDGVLSTDRGRLLAQRFIKEGAAVFIVTARGENQSKSVYEVADILGIKRNRVIFTNHRDKADTVKRLKINVHYDNNAKQITKIDEQTKTRGVLFHN